MVVAFELFSPKYFRVFSEDLLYLAQRLENGRDPWSEAHTKHLVWPSTVAFRQLINRGY